MKLWLCCFQTFFKTNGIHATIEKKLVLGRCGCYGYVHTKAIMTQPIGICWKKTKITYLGRPIVIHTNAMPLLGWTSKALQMHMANIHPHFFTWIQHLRLGCLKFQVIIKEIMNFSLWFELWKFARNKEWSH